MVFLFPFPSRESYLTVTHDVRKFLFHQRPTHSSENAVFLSFCSKHTLYSKQQTITIAVGLQPERFSLYFICA